MILIAYLRKYAAYLGCCYPFQEKSPAIIIWHSSIGEETIAQDLYQNMLKSRISYSLEPKGQWPWDLVCSIWDVGPTRFAYDESSLTLTYFMARSNLIPNAMGDLKKCIQSVTLGVKFQNCSIIIFFTSS